MTRAGKGFNPPKRFLKRLLGQVPGLRTGGCEAMSKPCGLCLRKQGPKMLWWHTPVVPASGTGRQRQERLLRI